MELVAQRQTVRCVLREAHFFEKDSENAVDRRIIRHLHFLALVAGRIPNLNGHQSHSRVLMIQKALQKRSPAASLDAEREPIKLHYRLISSEHGEFRTSMPFEPMVRKRMSVR